MAGDWVNTLDERVQSAGDKLLYRFLEDGESPTATMSYAHLARRAKAVATVLSERASAGARVLVVAPPGVGFIESLFGCFHAGLVAVPTYPPRSARHARILSRLKVVSDSCRPSLVIGESSQRSIFSSIAGFDIPFVAVDEISTGAGDGWRMPAINDQTLACLQYTSGTTGDAKGVMLSHGNLTSNAHAIVRAFDSNADSHGVIWLPPYHDMGLIGGILVPMYGEFSVTLMPPTAFLQQPSQWVRAISRYRGTISGGPNFAYELCARSMRDQEFEGLDLSSWEVAFTGAEPIRPATLDRFVSRFSKVGFRRSALLPCYGLAEASLMVSCARRGIPQVMDAGEQKAIGCGQAAQGTAIAIVDPQTHQLVADGTAGEIWVSGAGVAGGYWDNPDLTARTFGQTLEHDERRYVRTGDMGMRVDGELCVLSRIKDVLIVRGINYAPSDLEQSSEAAHDAIQPDGCAAFAIEGTSGTDELVLAVELRREMRNVPPDEVFEAIRAAVAQGHEIDVSAIVLLRPASLARTPSGKLQRHAVRQAYLDGTLEPIAHWRISRPQCPDESLPTRATVRDWMIRQVAIVTGVSPEQVDATAPLARYGLSSADAVGLAGRISQGLGLDLPATLMWDHPTIDELSDYLQNARMEEDQGVANLLQAGML